MISPLCCHVTHIFAPVRTFSSFISYPNHPPFTCCDYVLHSVPIVLRPCLVALLWTINQIPKKKKKKKKKKDLRYPYHRLSSALVISATQEQRRSSIYLNQGRRKTKVSSVRANPLKNTEHDDVHVGKGRRSRNKGKPKPEVVSDPATASATVDGSRPIPIPGTYFKLVATPQSNVISHIISVHQKVLPSCTFLFDGLSFHPFARRPTPPTPIGTS